MINQIVTRTARKEFERALCFSPGPAPELPSCRDNEKRLLYLHVPFCEELCPYCSFHRIRFDAPTARKYFRALRREIEIYRDRGYQFEGIYVGGGTPTVLMDELAETLALSCRIFPVMDISVETNPNHLTSENISILRDCGVKRLSVGVQTFNDELLKKIGRYEKYGSGEVIAARLKDVQGSLHTFNADMIFNFPGQTPQMLEEDLRVLLGLNMEQITFYPLMISSLTQDIMEQTMGAMDFSGEEKFYKLIVRRLESKYDFSSAWCFSRKESLIDEYVVDYEEYAGLGSGAIGYLYGTCYSNTFNIEAYMDALEKGKLPLQAARRFDLHDRMRYDFLMKLFSTKLDLTAMQKKYDGKFLKTLWKEIAAFEIVRAFRYFPPYLHLTPYGRYLWVIMMREFFIAVNNFRDYCRRQAKME
ncbi:MAG TPA: coproporphyrinogen III oxidase family protein [Smithella sp.]|nr:coproporphyrinogen III oxidase family protein [Smithella sp.]HRS96886.1 coproporphyrinogen III oxidase family protein [Smithella sp.]